MVGDKGGVVRMLKEVIIVIGILFLIMAVVMCTVGCSASAEVTGVKLSVSHSVNICCMHVSAVKSEDGTFMLSGYIYDTDGNIYETTDGFQMSADGVERLLSVTRGDMEPYPKSPKFHADDAPVKKLEITYSDGRKELFSVTETMETGLREIFLNEFKDSCPAGH